MEWISVKERLPERNEPLIGYNDDDVQEVMMDNFEATVLAYSKDRGCFKAKLHSWGWSEVAKNSIDSTVEVTHWMPLPSPPES